MTSTNEPTIRDAQAGDGPELTELVRRSSAYDGPYRTMVEHQVVDAAYVAANPTRVLVADGRTVAGFASLLVPGRGGPGEAELDFMFVADGQQGRGFGRLLMADIASVARRLGIRRIHIVSHPPAEAFYRAAGARPVGVLPPSGRITWSRPILTHDLSASEGTTGPAIRSATPADAEAVAAIWREGWRDGHLGNVPDALVAIRTPESFADRAAQRVADTVVADVDGAVAGFVMVVEDEVEQVYVSGEHRGTGVAAALLTEAERIVAGNGHREAWLAVVAGNERARRFYERCGWRDEGGFEYAAVTLDDIIPVPARRYVKPLQQPT